MAQQKERPTDDHIQSIHELSGELHSALEKVLCSHHDALEMGREWRRKQIESIEQRYMSQCHNIDERYDRLISLERDVRHRLATEFLPPAADLIAPVETLIAIRQKIDSIRQDVWQLRWNAVTKDSKVNSIPMHSYIQPQTKLLSY